MRQKLSFGLVILFALLLTSCEKISWTRGSIDYAFAPVTQYDGYFENRQIYYPEDIALVGRGSVINDFNFLSSQVEITGNLQAGDVIRGLVIDIDGVGKYSFPAIPVYRNGEVITIADSRNNSEFYNFMRTAFNYMNRYGKQDIIVSGFLEDRYGRDVVGATVSVSFYNDLDVSVSD